jgi:hypothetical protein
MAIIKFETNVPQLLSLAFSEGKPVVSPMTGAQLMFSTVDADRFYVPPIVGEKLKEHGVTARQQFELCKRQVGRSIEWQVKTHNAAEGAVSEATPTAAPVRSLKGTASQGYNSDVHGDRPLTATLDATYTAISEPPPSGSTREISPRAKQMMAAMLDAVDVVIETERYLERRGLEVQAEFESIRAIAATFFIQESKGGGA